jgi:hypothetical protein
MTKLSFLSGSVNLLGSKRRDGIDGKSPVKRNDDHTSMDNGRAGLNFEVLRRGR